MTARPSSMLARPFVLLACSLHCASALQAAPQQPVQKAVHCASALQAAPQPPVQDFERLTGLRVLAHSPSVLVIDKPAGLRSTPAFTGGGTRKERWCAVATALEALPPALRRHAAMLPRTREKFLAFAARRAKLSDDAAADAWRDMQHAVAAKDEADGVVELDSALRRARLVHGDARPVHRLDASTSGALALALDGHAASVLARQWRDRAVRKTYEAVVRGRVADDFGEIDVALERRDAARAGLSRMVPCADGKPCRTTFAVVDRGADTTTLELEPHTGRLHQLRAHCAAIGHPILGDDIYGDDAEGSRLHLHAKALRFAEPSSGDTWTVESASGFR